jgi:hypothetical protein
VSRVCDRRASAGDGSRKDVIDALLDTEVLVMADWSQKLAYYQLSGIQVGEDIDLDYDPCVGYVPHILNTPQSSDYSVTVSSLHLDPSLEPFACERANAYCR